MLGKIFTEFCEMVEKVFSPEVLDRIILRAELASGGAYTAVGYYPDEEIQRLVTELARETGTPVPALLEAFGEYLFPRLLAGHAQVAAGCDSLWTLLDRLEDTIHPNVLRLYPQAQLPSFHTIERGPERIRLAYRSPRRMEHLAIGLIRGAARHFGTPVAIDLEIPEDGSEVHFDVRRAH